MGFQTVHKGIKVRLYLQMTYTCSELCTSRLTLLCLGTSILYISALSATSIFEQDQKRYEALKKVDKEIMLYSRKPAAYSAPAYCIPGSPRANPNMVQK